MAVSLLVLYLNKKIHLTNDNSINTRNLSTSFCQKVYLLILHRHAPFQLRTTIFSKDIFISAHYYAYACTCTVDCRPAGIPYAYCIVLQPTLRAILYSKTKHSSFEVSNIVYWAMNAPCFGPNHTEVCICTKH
jgi:hypothetical protein